MVTGWSPLAKSIMSWTRENVQRISTIQRIGQTQRGTLKFDHGELLLFCGGVGFLSLPGDCTVFPHSSLFEHEQARNLFLLAYVIWHKDMSCGLELHERYVISM